MIVILCCANSSEPANLGVRLCIDTLILMIRFGLEYWQRVSVVLQRVADSIFLGSDLDEPVKCSSLNSVTTWPVALSQIHAIYEEVLYSTVPLRLSSHPPHLWLRTDVMSRCMILAMYWLSNLWVNYSNSPKNTWSRPPSSPPGINPFDVMDGRFSTLVTWYPPANLWANSFVNCMFILS